MKRSMRHLTAVLAPGLWITLAIGCSSRPPQPAQPASGMEPGQPSTQQAPQKPGEMQKPGETQKPTSEVSPGEKPQEGQRPGLGSGLRQPGVAPPEGAADEKALCDAIASEAKLHVEDVQGGVAIVIVPKSSERLSSVRDHTRFLEGAMRAGSAQGETCGVAELGRLPNVSVGLTEGDGSLRLVMTTTNASEVKDLQRIARDEVATLNKAAR